METEDPFRTLFEKSADGQFLSKEHVFMNRNDTALQMMCCSQKADILGHRASKFSPPKKVREMLGVAMAKGSHRFAWAYRRRDGTGFPTKVSLTTVTVKGKLLVHAVVRNVTDRDRSQGALKETEARFKQLFDSMKTYLDFAGTFFAQSPPTPDIVTKKRAVGPAGSDKEIAQLRGPHG